MPQAIIAFLESTDYEDAIRNGISIGGDSDTIACMAGSIAAAFHKKIPEKMLEFANNELPDDFIKIINQFDDKYTR